MTVIPASDPLAQAVTRAIKEGETSALRGLLSAHPELAAARITDGCGEERSLLHLVADWPGHFPNGAETVQILVAAGADVKAPFVGRHRETALHWAASCDDVSVLDALLDAGSDLDAPGSVINGESALADAVAFGQWKAARRLVERGARANLWQSAALGLRERVEAEFAGDPPTPEEVTKAFWCACHGCQRSTAEYLLERGAELNWVGYDGLTPLDAARRTDAGAEPLLSWLVERGAVSAKTS